MTSHSSAEIAILTDSLRETGGQDDDVVSQHFKGLVWGSEMGRMIWDLFDIKEE